MLKGISVGLVLLVGCTAEPGRSATPKARVDLRAALPVNDLYPAGIAITSTGERFVFDEWLGLLRVDGDQVIPVMPLDQMPTPDKPVRPPFTDIVALAPDLFAMTALGDGFLLDLSARTLTQHFCYVPDGGDGFPTPITQRTDAIAYDAVADKLYAQPVTYDAGSNLQYAQVARYSRGTGADEEWLEAPMDMAATGSVFIPDVGLLFGQGPLLSRYDFETRTVIEIDSLTRFGILSIDGLALDPVTNSLVVVDKIMDATFDIDLADVSL